MFEGWIKTLRSLSHYLETVELYKYDHVTPFLDAPMTLRDQSAHVLVSKIEVLYLGHMIWKTATVTQISRSGMLKGKDMMKQVWKHGEKMSCQGIGDTFFMQRSTALVGAEFPIFRWIADTM